MRTRKIRILHALVRAGDKRRLRRALERLDDVEIAEQLDNLETDDQLAALRLVPASRRAEIIGAMRYESAAGLVAALAPEEAASVVDDLDADDAVDILGYLPEGALSAILKQLNREDADEIEDLLAYDEETAGGLMSPQFFSCFPGASVRDALEVIQSSEEPPENAFYVYVCDEEDRLVGVCSLRMLVISRPEQPLRDIMLTEVTAVAVGTDQEDVAEMVSRYDLVAVPVVDDQRRLIGVIDVDDVVDVIREEATEDILKMAGAGEDLADARSFMGALRVRWRWLMAAAVGGTLAALSISGFDGILATAPELAFFMPVVAAMGGNIGIQSSTIVVRGLAVGYIEADRVRLLVVREVSLGVVMGLLFGILIGLVSMWVADVPTDPLRLGVVVALGTAGSMTIAAAVGTSTPLILDRLDIDPAVATGPFVTTSVDIAGLLFYFWLASRLLGLG
ncbi:MAG: magnesium transporter [Nannocystaceae bacterium]|nr:magnesium transporter [Nannocystaceae bacterium]